MSLYYCRCGWIGEIVPMGAGPSIPNWCPNCRLAYPRKEAKESEPAGAQPPLDPVAEAFRAIENQVALLRVERRAMKETINGLRKALADAISENGRQRDDYQKACDDLATLRKEL